jgi:predicted Zn-dependent protease
MNTHRFGFTADRGVLEASTDIAVEAFQGITDVIAIAGLDIDLAEETLSMTDALTNTANQHRLENGQIDGDWLYSSVVESGFCSPDSPKYLLLSDDLTTRNTNFVFGFSVKERGISIQSIARFKRAGKELPSLTRHIARHEYGHLLGLDGDSIVNQDTRGGLYKGHCANTCTMQQVMTAEEALLKSRELKAKPMAGFCLDCVDVLVELHR